MKSVVSIPNNEIRKSFLTPENLELLSSMGEVVINPYDGDRQYTEEELSEVLKGADAYFTIWCSPALTEGALKNAKDLKLLVHLGGTVVPFVSDAMWDKGIKALSGNDYFAESVAEGVIAYMLTALRDIPNHLDAFTNGHKWNPKNLSHNGLLDKTIGIVSYGQVSHHLVKMLKPFRCKILIYDIVKIPEEDLKEYNMEQVSLEEVFSKSEIVTVQTPLNKATYHLIGKELFDMLPDGSLFINTSRGSVIDEKALIEALEKNRFRAFLDVYEEEPPKYDENKLFGLPNVFLMPHKAGPTIDRRAYIAKELIKEAYDYIENGKPLKHEIKREVAEKMSRS